jgi:hypothetical protein
MIYRPWKTYEEQAAAFYCVFVCGYSFDDARSIVLQATADLLNGMANLGRASRNDGMRALEKYIDGLQAAKRLMPVVVSNE